MAVDLGVYTGLWQQGGAAALGSWLAGILQKKQSCHCICETIGGSPVLALLEKQLDRCGPEHLTVAEQQGAACWTGVTVLGAFACGLLAGCVLTWRLVRVWVRGAGEDAFGHNDADGALERATAQRKLRALRG